MTALLEAAQQIQENPRTSTRVVFLTDCKSAIQALQSPKDKLERDTAQLLSTLSQRMTVTLQWIPAHCGLTGNEEADSLAKSASKKPQPTPAVSYKEAKALVKHKFPVTTWKETHSSPPNDDDDDDDDDDDADL